MHALQTPVVLGETASLDSVRVGRTDLSHLSKKMQVTSSFF